MTEISASKHIRPAREDGATNGYGRAECGEGCEKDSEQWKRCAELSDEDWLELLAGGMFFTDFFESIL